MKQAAGWLRRAARRRARPLLPRRPRTARAAAGAQARAAGPAAARRDAPRCSPSAPPQVSLAHMALRFPPVAQFLERFRAVLRRRRRFDFDAEVGSLSRIDQAVAFLALLELRKTGEIALEQAAPFAPDKGFPSRRRKGSEWIARSA